MPPVKPYSPSGTGTLADVLERGPELSPVRPAGPDSFAPAPSWGDLFSASRPAALQATPGYDDTKIGEGYAPIIDALGLPASENPGYYGSLDPQGEARVGSVGSPSQLASDAQVGELVPFSNRRLADRAVQESLVVAQIKARRAKDPGFLSGVPDTADGLHDYFEQQQVAKRAQGASVLARGSTFGRLTAGFAAGGVESAVNDPTFLPSLFIGGGTAETFLQAVGRDALINGVLTAGQQPMLATHMAEGGEHLTLGQAVGNVVEGAAFGGIFGGTIHLSVTHIPPALFQIMPESVQRRWADRMQVGDNGPLLKDVVGDMDNRELSAFARTTLGDRMTPDERSAANVLERAQEVGEASPFLPGPVGDAAHRASIAEGLKAILDGAPDPAPSRGALLSSSSLTAAPTTVSRPLSIGVARVPSDIVDFFKSKGLDEAHAYGIAAGIVAESGGDHTAVNRSSGAFGLGQQLGSRKTALFERYGPNPSRQDQLENLWRELTGGDPGGKFVLEAKDAGSVLDAYIRKFMRPAAGHETTSDLERGMAALGHKGELAEGSGASSAAGDEDLAGDLQRDAAAADQEALELAGTRDRENADLGPRSSRIDPAEVPILKRELFPSDQDWAEAQAAFHQQVMGENAPQSAGNGPPARETVQSGADTPAQGVEIASEPPRTAYRGIPTGVENPFKVADRGPLGAGVYLSGQPTVARMYGPELVHAHVSGKIFDGRVAGVMDPELKARLLSHMSAEERARFDRMDNPRLYRDDFVDRVSRSVEPERMGEIFKAEGFSGIEANRDGHEIVVFEPSSISLAEPRPSIARNVDHVRIDDPELKSFDVGGSGRDSQVESLEHDARMQAAEAHLQGHLAELGSEPPRPRDVVRVVKDLLGRKSNAAGLRYRINAEDAISHGIDADKIYISAKAKHPVVKLQYQGIFGSPKGPLRSKAAPTKLVSLDWFGDRLDPYAFGIHQQERLEPEQIGELLRAGLDRSDEALDRSDPRHEPYVQWWERHNNIMALDGQPAHPVTGETLPEAQQRSEELRESFPSAEPGGSAGTHNIPNSAPVPEGGTRGELRVKIFNAMMAKPAKVGHEAHLVLGPPAAGKSSVAEPLAAATHSRLIDGDEAKAMLPEFDNGIGAAAVHEESSRLAAVAADATIRKGENVVLPIVGKTFEGVKARIEELVKAGYDVHVHLVDLPGDKAVDRAIARFQETGRLVDPEYVRSVGNRPAETFARLTDEYNGKLGGHVHVSNDVPLGERPRLVQASSPELAARLGYDRPAKPGEGARAAPGGSGSDAGAAAQEGVSSLKTYQLADDRPAQTLAEILADLDADQAAVDALKSCALPRAA